MRIDQEELNIPFAELIKDFPKDTLQSLETRILSNLTQMNGFTPTATIEKTKTDLAEVRRLIKVHEDAELDVQLKTFLIG